MIKKCKLQSLINNIINLHKILLENKKIVMIITIKKHLEVNKQILFQVEIAYVKFIIVKTFLI